MTTSSETVRCLREARQYIERGWAQGYSARDRDGVGVEALSPRAVSWCAGGAAALATATGDGRYPYYRKVRTALQAVCSTNMLATYNDLRTTRKADILALYDRAIETESKASLP